MKLKNVISALSNGTFLSSTSGWVLGKRNQAFRNNAFVSATKPFGRFFGVTPSLEYAEMHLVHHCNLKCKGCSHFSPLFDKDILDRACLEKDLSALKKVFDRVQTLRLMGGEPLLHPDVAQICALARKFFPRDTIALVTNGLLLTRQPESFWTTLHDNNIRLDVSGYPVNIDYEKIRALAAQYAVDLRIERHIERFESLPITQAPTQNPAEEFNLCRTSRYCPFVINEQIFPCATIPLSSALEDKFNFSFIPQEKRGMRLDDKVDAWDVIFFLNKANPWCAHCKLEASTEFNWSVTSYDESEWISQ